MSKHGWQKGEPEGDNQGVHDRMVDILYQGRRGVVWVLDEHGTISYAGGRGVSLRELERAVKDWHKYLVELLEKP